MKKLICIAGLALITSCQTVSKVQEKPFVWEGANLYFLLTDRFKNGDTSNDVQFGRTEKASKLRGFEGGDLRGVIQKVEDNYFFDLGVNAIWMTPLVEQIHGYTDEGTGKTYGFHGYWAKDWTSLDPNFGTKKELKELVSKAHAKGIRIVLDVVINHTGPVTSQDPKYPNDWVRTSPQCTYSGFETTTACTLVANLPDILTEEDKEVKIPQFLLDKWKQEGRLQQELKSLDAFFAKYRFPRASKYYIMKWLADYITEFGVDGFRVDTVKHVHEQVWKDFQKVCDDAFAEYKAKHPSPFQKNQPFFMVGEVYGYGISQKKLYDFGDKKVNYFENGFTSLINFDFKGDANKPYEDLFSSYSNILNSDLKGVSVMNYISSHDDGSPFDKERKRTIESGTKLLLTPGISQIYYGDESARSLIIDGTEGDATLRSNVNWDDIKSNPETKKVLEHWQKLGRFRANHPAVGAGVHQMISRDPYVFFRSYQNDRVVIGLDLPKGKKTIGFVYNGTMKNGGEFEGYVFKNGTKLRDAYSGKIAVVKDLAVELDTEFSIVLLEEVK